MIGQHIYSRCTEGYFSRSGSKGDSTTVTISRDMFAREDQAKLVAFGDHRNISRRSEDQEAESAAYSSKSCIQTESRRKYVR